MPHLTRWRGDLSGDSGNVLLIALLGMLIVAMATSVLLLSAASRSRGVAREADLAQQRHLRQASIVRVDEMLAVAGVHNPERMLPPMKEWQPPTGDMRWRVLDAQDIPFVDSSIRGAAERRSVEVTFQWATGCTPGRMLSPTDDPSEHCHVVDTTSRRYEHRSFLQYQLHYEQNDIPNRWCEGDAQCLAFGGMVVFADGDLLDGPIHTNLSSILYCGAPAFNASVEIAGDPNLSAFLNGPGCIGTPTFSGRPMAHSDLVNGGHLGVARLPGTEPPVCGGSVDWLKEGMELAEDDDHNITASLDLSTTRPGDIHTAPGVNIEVFGAAPGSVTIVAEGTITVIGDLSAPIGEVVGLVVGCDVVLDPAGARSSTELVTGVHDLSLSNIAVLAPAGGMWANAWAKPHGLDPACAGAPPPPFCGVNPNTPTVLNFSGAVASRYLGLFGRLLPDPSGWVKEFSYPTGFWQVQPPWWPALEQGNWVPHGGRGGAVPATTTTVH